MTIEQLFNPISARISEHENTLYQTDVYGKVHFYSEVRMVENNIGQFPLEKAIPILEFNIKRLNVLIDNLYKKIPEEVLMMDRDDLITPVYDWKEAPKLKNKKKPDKAVPYIHDLIHLDELEYFKDWMMLMLKPRLAQRQQTVEVHVSTIANSKTIIELSEKFPLKDLANHYNPTFTPKQAALLLNYLMISQTIPFYGPKTFGRLVKVLFARNEKNGSDDYAVIDSLKQNDIDLQKLTTVLHNIIGLIEKDIAKVKKPNRRES